MHRSSLGSCFAALAFVLAADGCSFAFVETVPDEPQKLPYFDCTSTIGLPVADGVFALGAGVTAGFTLAQSKQEFEDENDGANRDVAAGVDIAFAAAMLASGIYGVIQTSQCADAKAELRERLMPESGSKHTPIAPPAAAPVVPAPMPAPPVDATPQPPEAQPAPAAPPPSDLPANVPAPPPSAPAPQPAP